MPTLDKQLENAQKRVAIEAEKVKRLQLEQSYRAIEDRHNRRKRRAPQIEFGDEESQVQGTGRLKGIAKARDTRRNYAGAKAVELQLRLNVVGKGPKIIVHLDNQDQGKEWTDWFNRWFSRRCDGRGNLHLSDQANITFTSVIREGDILAYFDREGVIPDAEGTVWYWEADQMPEINAREFERNESKIRKRIRAKGKLKQRQGLVLDQWGRVQGYVVCSQPGKPTAKYDEVTILPADDCTLLFNPWRINQKRGISDTMETANQWQDLERFTEALLQRSILQSFVALKVKKEDGAVVGRDRVTDSEHPDGKVDVTSDDAQSDTRYKNFEKWSQNAIEYLDQNDDIEAMQLSGDLPDAQALIEFMQNGAGWSQGLSAMYATGKADASYSASMAESNMTWAMFHWWQKWIERYFFDWVAEKAFLWAVETGKITRARAFDWMDNYSWHGWPERKAINPAHEANARKTDLETGSINYKDIHGPYWKEELALLGEQIQWSRDKGLWVPMWAQNGKAAGR